MLPIRPYVFQAIRTGVYNDDTTICRLLSRARHRTADRQHAN